MSLHLIHNGIVSYLEFQILKGEDSVKIVNGIYFGDKVELNFVYDLVFYLIIISLCLILVFTLIIFILVNTIIGKKNRGSDSG